MQEVSQEGVFEEILNLLRELRKDIKGRSDGPNEVLKSIIRADKYNVLYCVHPILVHVLVFSGVYCKKALSKYLTAYNAQPAETKEEFISVLKTYLIHFDNKILNSIRAEKGMFIQFYVKMMEELFSKIEDKQLMEDEQETIDKQRALKNRDLLKQRLNI